MPETPQLRDIMHGIHSELRLQNDWYRQHAIWLARQAEQLRRIADIMELSTGVHPDPNSTAFGQTSNYVDSVENGGS